MEGEQEQSSVHLVPKKWGHVNLGLTMTRYLRLLRFL